jgi:hypothetical protein
MIHYGKLALIFFRCIGVIWVLTGLGRVLTYLYLYVRSTGSREGRQAFEVAASPGVITFAGGIFLLVLAPLIARWISRGLDARAGNDA